ncbi:putative U-box domain-containing protein 50 [Coffea eugenioides]|uniref:putative U-box domain-containing protein 50 n=1 Tax=Coffea eugenioides TaxID=49369 RepID=UPI000F60A81D|nr:putative U-box domain-containing protein 50 [Coffea eugenioides]
METDQPAERIFVAIGTDLNDGFATLEWVLKKWNSHPIKIVILFSDNYICRDYVFTPIGKIPAGSVREEKLKVLEKSEEAKSDKILSKYIAFCGKVKAEGLRIDRYEEPIHKVVLGLITSLRITKLVMAFSLLRPLSWKSRSAMNASFYLQSKKPNFCELFVIFNGKLVYLKEETNEGFIEDDQGVIVARIKERPSFKGWIGKFFPENANGKNHCESPSSSSASNGGTPDQWEKYGEEIEKYFNELSSSIANEGNSEEANDTSISISPELNMAENMAAAEKIEILKIKIRDTQESIQSNKEEARANAEKCAKAKWAIGLCTARTNDLEARIHEEIAKRMDLQKDLDSTKEELFEIQSEVEEKRNKLNPILELQRELSNKLQLSTLAKSRVESQLEKAVRNRAEMVQEIEELRRQRDVLQRRIEFCKEKDAIGMANRLNDLCFDYRKFTAAEIRAATDDFSECLRLKSAADWTNVYRGRVNRTTVAIKLSNSYAALSQDTFLEKVKLLGHIRHPHILSMMGFCTEPKCIVFEYMHNGCLRDILFSSHGGRNHGLNWHARIRVAAEVCMGLSFLHKAKPKPLVHGNLNPSKILLDRNNVARIHGFKPCPCNDASGMRADIRAFGTLLLQLLTGRNWARVGEEAIMVDSASLTEALDKMAGPWPLDLAMELGGIASCCLAIDESLDKEFSSKSLMRRIERVRENADELLANGECLLAADGDSSTEVSVESNVPSVFYCPIYQDIMKNPHIAADGFSYELEAIEEWLRTGHDTSPMTNLRLKHKQLTPNHTLRSLIQDWHNKRSIPY